MRSDCSDAAAAPGSPDVAVATTTGDALRMTTTRRFDGDSASSSRGGRRERVGRAAVCCCRTKNTVMALLLMLLLADAGCGRWFRWSAVDAEVIFHRRDHRDQGEYTSNSASYHVTSYSDALQYLQKYGYLENCTASVHRRRRSLAAIGASEAVVVPIPRDRGCSDLEIRQALRRLQRRFSLRPSGRLDDDTRSLMSRGRCGNTDSEQRRAQLQREPEVVRDASRHAAGASVAEMFPAPPPPPAKFARSSLSTRRRLRRSPDLERRARLWRRAVPEIVVVDDDDDAGSGGTPTVVVQSSMLGSTRRGQNVVDHARLYRYIVENVDAASSRGRRLAMLHEYTERHRRLENERQAARTSPRTAADGERLQRGRSTRARRSISVDQIHEGPTAGDSASDEAGRLINDENKPVQWRLLEDGVSGKIPLSDQRAILELAFRMWSEVIPLKFNEASGIHIVEMDVIIAFAKQDHMNCDKPFDGHGGELAHSWTGGDIHFDEDENYRKDDPTGNGINLLKVAVHEIGHVLGLLHNDRENSIMYPIYVNPDMYEDFELCRDDRKAVQSIYGVCKGKFDVVFDWLRKVRAADGVSARYIFNTYFFRRQRYWMYENRFNRTRFGDPLRIEREWTGLPSTVDAYVQVIAPSGGEYAIDTYFFSGDSYYKYDDDIDRVAAGYPRKIAADFGSKVDGGDVIPNDVDAVLFDNRDSMLYFFKGEWVWIYNSHEIGRNACCEGKVTFTSLYPTSVDSTSSVVVAAAATTAAEAEAGGDADAASPSSEQLLQTSALTGNVDAVFYSYHFHQMFFFSGEDVYVNVAYDERTAGANLLERRGHWYDIWYDICDVE